MKKRQSPSPPKILNEDLQKKLQELKDLEDRLYMKENLPFLFGYNLFPWQHEFIHTKNKNALICSSNQSGKSLSQSIRLLNLATDIHNWSSWFSRKPDCFWMLLPSKEMIESMIDVKWIPNLLPKGRFKEHPRYGWQLKKSHGSYSHMVFNSGIHLYFKSYEMGAEKLQSGSCDYIAADEEMKEELLPELNARRSATNGYFSIVMTPTLGLEFWRNAFEEVGSEKETFKGAFKKSVSLYDCQKFVDGTVTQWTNERIQQVINSCPTEAEVKRRVFGRFVKSEGLLMPMFSVTRNVAPYHPINFTSGYIYAAIDSGAGDTGRGSHPATICFVWVNAELSKIRVFKGWKSPKGQAVEPKEILEKYVELRGTMVMAGEFYDWSSKDIQIIANRAGIALMPADKSRDKGYQMLNLLFKTGALVIYDIEELQPLVREIMSLSIGERKTEAQDDFVDAMRYAITSIPINWEKVTDIKVDFDEGSAKQEKIIDMRMMSEQDIDKLQAKNNSDIMSEIEFWNKHYEGVSD